jgi:O-succinylhomoserine sulfhydrylase
MADRHDEALPLCDGLDLDQWKRAMQPNTRTCFLESPTNPTLDVLDIQSIAEIAHEAGARLIVDNVFATPIWQSPLSLGADVVIYSATKHIDGQGRCLGGIILSSEAFIAEHIHNFMRQTGPSMSPFNAWVLLKGLETLQIRMLAQSAAALELARWLAVGAWLLLGTPRTGQKESGGGESDRQREEDGDSGFQG